MRGKIIATLMTLLLVIGLTPVLAVDVGTGVGIGLSTEAYTPKLFMATESRVVTDDNVPTGRNNPGGNLGNDTLYYHSCSKSARLTTGVQLADHTCPSGVIRSAIVDCSNPA